MKEQNLVSLAAVHTHTHTHTHTHVVFINNKNVITNFIIKNVNTIANKAYYTELCKQNMI